jgi:hypothetical protein
VYQRLNLGMSDEQLESLSKTRRISMGLSPWATFESERTSFGRLFRRRALYPAFLPLMISSDHYVSPLTVLRDNESHSGQGAYFSWNRTKVHRLQAAGVNAYHTVHPWMAWRRKHFHRAEVTRGTIVFWPHSHQTLTPEIDESEFIARLLGLPEDFHPFTLCISSHDIDKGLHRVLRRFDIPIVTAGDIKSQSFVQRFYHLLEEAKYAAGPNVGSQTFYCLEAGIPYRLVGEDLFSIRVIEPDGGLGARYDDISVDFPEPEERERFLEFRNSLALDVVKVTDEQFVIARSNLGLDSEMSRFQFSCVVWGEAVRNFPSLIRLWFRR